MGAAAAALAGLQGAGSLWGLLSGNSTANWAQGALTNVLNTDNQANSTGLGLALENFDPLRNTGMATYGLGQNMLNDPSFGAANMQQLAGNALSTINPSQFTPGAFTNLLNNSTGQLYNANNALGGTTANGGLVNGYMNPGQNLSYSMLSGANPGQSNMLNTGTSMMANNGQTPMSQAIQAAATSALGNGGATAGLTSGMNSAMNAASSGGQTGATNFGLGAAQQLIANGGLNTQGQIGQNTALSGLLGGGQTGTTNALQGIGTNYAGQQAVLPTGLAASIAEDQAHQQAQNSAEAAEAQALARGGGPGATVANGSTNQASGDFFNQISQNSSNAYENALLQQQGLNLQQQGQGAQMALGAGGIGAQQLGIYGNLLQQLTGEANTGLGTGLSSLGNLTNAQTNLLGTGLSAIPSMQNAQTNNVQTYGQLGLGAGNLANQTASTGGSLLNDYLGSTVNGGSLLNSLSGTQGQTMIGAGNAYNNGISNAGQLNLGGLNGYYNNYNNLFGNVNNANTLGYNLNNSGMNALSGLYQPSLSYAQTGLSGENGLFQSYATQALKNSGENTPGYLSGLGSTAGQIMKAATGGN